MARARPLLYPTPKDWRETAARNVLFYGMSGLGKTHISNMLRAAGDWFHYSIDYRIGTRYLGEQIVNNAMMEAMKVPFLQELLRSDSIYIGSNISFDNLAPVSTYLGKPGAVSKGGLPFESYVVRQEQFRNAEINALLDTGYFIERAKRIYGYQNFICDTGGSICEWVHPSDFKDPILCHLAARTAIIWIKGDESHTQELIRRFEIAPKPMAYRPGFTSKCWVDFMEENACNADQVDPNAFLRFAYRRSMAERQSIYQAIANNWATAVVTADEISAVRDPSDFADLVADAFVSGI
ncbi:ATPase [uncultured Roseovarius sp.]|uniref:ATPase n=1 Tax=uncultured Roseovarius sp. TaxID=293344 RepID=UPI00260DF996|nr:ATPase [uncultured Roseovarius sp.]